jgi:hypothetical protein
MTGLTNVQPYAGYDVNGHGLDLATTFRFNARVSASAQVITGSIVLSGFIQLHGVLTCGAIEGTKMTGGYRIVSGSLAGRGFIAAVQRSTPLSPGAILWYKVLRRAPVRCPSPNAPPTSAASGAPLTSGTITVRPVLLVK